MSVLRLPFAAAPYLLKLMLIFTLRGVFFQHWNTYPMQAIRTLGDFANFGVGSLFLWSILARVDIPVLKILLSLIIASEFVRLLTEKGTMTLSAFWQMIPHRFFAEHLSARVFKGYVSYYMLPNEKRLQKVLRRLKASARHAGKSDALKKLAYVNSFCIVDDNVNLRAGNVRNVARGEIYVHANWANNPDLLCGQALRRSPWIFDPRYLRRPFYYRTEANHLMTRFVFENARFCPLYAMYQFGHEIKSARYDIFYQCLRHIGFNIEPVVCADGTNCFDLLAHYTIKTPICRPLWNDDEVLAELTGKPIPFALEIAEKYTYPLCYVQDVLLKKLLMR